ncbi:metallophosphoesterase [Pontibacillus litoralis]|uniref:Metallophosphoesterase n=1 Tax=Pontibacillus litoralis JSM 072002 TaxID=1385512 RepID=A0A0A5FVF9_9BACI|nr:metallophosphoesterase [Pontibacillus litoralis]KGX84791.1 metallophosphoesterase [Pontibacillus litoralis JSM 072002]
MVVVAFVIGIMIWIGWELFFVFPTRWLKVERVEWDSEVNKKILQISDLHIRNMRVSLNKIRRVIEEEQPDYIFLTGDFIDRTEKELPKLERFLSMIETDGVESYAVLGNHDRHLTDVGTLERLLNRYNIRLMKNEWVEKEDVVIVGIDDYGRGHHNMEMSFSFANKKQKDVVVLTHDPNIIQELQHNYSMLVAGHLHGKQVNIPYFFHFVYMGQIPRNGIYKGKHYGKHGPFYISKGIGQSHLNFRFMVRSEVTIHELRRIV